MAHVPKPDEQARAEIHVALNGEATRLLHSVFPERTIQGLVARLEHAEREVEAWRDRAFIMEAAVRQYADHVWNDIEAMLSGVDV